ncbi:MAG: endonuclease [Melioribacteraceae bacterium]|nr:endonuclease [Melioribacteraceae bacterium]
MKKFSFSRIAVILLFIFSIHINAQDYYDGINTSSPTFISDLQTLIRTGYVKLSYDQYDENMIPGFYAQDLGGGNYRVTCVYTGYNYDYTGTFTWTPSGDLSREHTWCFSWMPSHPSTSVDEYSDYHHLFPTHQSNANGVRSNHPLGDVINITSSFLDGKYGTNASGENVYEPRDEQKGDAARALFYMALRYDGINGNDWSFGYLNNTTLPNLSSPEAPQDLQTLLDWHEFDPPDAWEISRNDYIHNIQKNRNPFIDHPEYVYLIDFTDMTKKSQIILPEPTNHVLNFAAVSSSGSQIDLTWTENDGTYAPDAYLIKVSSTDYNSITNPVDGTSQSNDLDLSDGSGAYNISHGNNSYSWSGLSSGTTYYFKIYPYTNSGSDIDYKTNGTIPQDDAETTNHELFFSEYVEGSSNNKALEIYNPGGTNIDLSASNYSIEFYSNGSSSASTTINLTGTIEANGVYVVADDDSHADILNVADQVSGSSFFNGDDAVVLKKGSSIIDVIGQVGFDPGTEWGTGLTSTADNTIRRKASVTAGDTNPSDAFDPTVEWDGYAVDTFGGLGDPAPLPVELVSFTASVNNDEVILLWETATELNNFGFEVERSAYVGTNRDLSAQWNKVGFVEGHGNSNSPKEYSFVDNKTFEVFPRRESFGQNLGGLDAKLQYRLKQIDYDGKFEYSEIITLETLGATSLPATFALEQNYPNPFNPITSIEYSVPSNEYVTLKVYDVLGNTVSILVNENKEAGKYNVSFDGSNLTSGIYFYSINAGGFTQVKKMMLVK